MTPAKKYRQNLDLILRLDAFLQECGNYDDRMKIIDEIARMRAENKQIEVTGKTKEAVKIDSTVLVLPST